AFLCASRLAPGDPSILDALAELAEGSFDERADILRARWRLDPAHPGPGQALFRSALQAGVPDAAFLAAAVLAARGRAAGAPDAFRERHGPRFLVRAMRGLDEDVFARVRHADDDPELGAVFALLAPAGFSHSPIEIEVGREDVVEELPEPFARVRD